MDKCLHTYFYSNPLQLFRAPLIELVELVQLVQLARLVQLDELIEIICLVQSEMKPYAMLCYAMLCVAMCCYAMPCSIVLFDAMGGRMEKLN